MAVSLKRIAVDSWDVIGQTISTTPVGTGNSRIVVKTLTDVAYTFGLDDDGSYLRPDTDVVSEYTVPSQAVVAWENDTEIHLHKAGVSTLILAAMPGVTLNPPADGTLQVGPSMTVVLKRVGVNIWDVVGQTISL
jgi:hypothetical protein